MLVFSWTGVSLFLLRLLTTAVDDSHGALLEDSGNISINCRSRFIRTSCGRADESVLLTANICSKRYDGTECEDCVSSESFYRNLMLFDVCRKDERILRIPTKKNLRKASMDMDLAFKEIRARIRKRQAPPDRLEVGWNRCTDIEPPRPGRISCRVSSRGTSCIGFCKEGYLFEDGTRSKIINCSKGREEEFEEEDVLKIEFPRCEPQCNPICQNGGSCSEVDICSCTNEYRGETCQYPISLCGIAKTSSASSWQCNHTHADTVCRASCFPPGSLQAESQADDYHCAVDGTWMPPLPSCVQTYARLCSKPEYLQFGRMELNSTGIYPPGTVASYSCNRGFSIRGAEDIVCLLNGTWSSPIPVCVMQYGCVEPGDLENGVKIVENEDFPVGSRVTYICDDDYVMIGNSSLKCRADGRWSSTKPICWKPIIEIVAESGRTGDFCAFTSTPTNAIVRLYNPDSSLGFRKVSEEEIDGTSNRRRDLRIRTFPVGSRVHYRCRSRFYKLYGTEYQTCQASGTWSGNKPACVPDCGKSDSPRTPFIVYGNSTEAGQWPWQVAISVSVQPDVTPDLVCGGALVSERIILTAAHCITREHSALSIDQRMVSVHCGKYHRSFTKDDKHVQTRKVRRIIVHRDYDFIKYDSDIALLELDSPVEFTSRVQPICLPTEMTTSENIRDGQLGVVLGWGVTERNRFSDVLRETVLPVVSRLRCEDNYRQGLKTISVTENMFCAGYGEGYSDTCTGDSGGTMMFPDTSQRPARWILEGIISWGSASGCGMPKQFSGFTKVGKFVDWIKLHL